VWDLITYSGQTDGGLMDCGEAQSHFYNAPNSSINFTVYGPNGSGVVAEAAAFQ
jgi:hypothetical protein